jgi:hypothetical protein
MKHARQCPHCGSLRVHPSHRRGVFDRLFAAMGGDIRRCHDCRARQAWFHHTPMPLPAVDHWPRMAMLGSGFLMCLMVLWWIIQRSAADSG